MFSSKVESVRIYNIKGEIVAEIRKRTWIPNLSSGVYIILIEADRLYIKKLRIVK